ncbi:MAG: ABC transporter permease [Clostridia bacterium]|nr:ABC transporter permease [Clostridia bacterium]
MIFTAFAGRNRRELTRDPLTVIFGLGFPLTLLVLLSAIQRNIPAPMFEIETLAPGVASFGLTFIALFSAMLISRDRSRCLMMRLCASPMRASDFILGYMLPLLPIAAAQIAVCYLAAALLGFSLNLNALVSLLTLLPCAVMYISIGLMCGTLLSDKQVGGVCGAALTNVCAWLSGIWFDLELLGDGFASFAHLLPFANAVDAARLAAAGNFSAALPPLLILTGYSAALTAFAVILFHRRLKSGRI